jgi:hypothetical protein
MLARDAVDGNFYSRCQSLFVQSWNFLFLIGVLAEGRCDGFFDMKVSQ